MVAAIAPFRVAHPLARRAGEGRKRLPRDGWPSLLLGRLRTVGVFAGLIPDCLELDYPVLEQRIGQVGDSALDRVVKPLELALCLCGTPPQIRDMRGAAFGALFPAGKD